jgi:hypothetical protein
LDDLVVEKAQCGDGDGAEQTDDDGTQRHDVPISVALR